MIRSSLDSWEERGQCVLPIPPVSPRCPTHQIVKHILSNFLLALLTVSATAESYPPNHPGFQYTGRVDFSDKAAPKITWPATQLRIKFTGASLKITLDDEQGKNSFMVFVDDKARETFVARMKERYGAGPRQPCRLSCRFVRLDLRY